MRSRRDAPAVVAPVVPGVGVAEHEQRSVARGFDEQIDGVATLGMRLDHEPRIGDGDGEARRLEYSPL